MNNHLNILPKLASFDLKCSKMRWRLGLRPRPRWGSLRRSIPQTPLIVRGNAPSALGTLYFVSIFTSQFPFRAPLTEFLDPPLGVRLAYVAPPKVQIPPRTTFSTFTSFTRLYSASVRILGLVVGQV